MNVMIAVLAVAVVLLASAAGRAARSADADVVTSGWAGYVVRAAEPFREVRGTWIQPRVVCNRLGSSVAVWVGLGGAGRRSHALEQVGTSADCSQAGAPSYSAWAQLFPAEAVQLTLPIHPGDVLSGRVVVNGTWVVVQLRDRSTGASFTRTLSMRLPETDSAEWIAEAPASCFATCEQLPLADFGRVAFADAFARSSRHGGTLGDPYWSRSRLAMVVAGRSVALARRPLRSPSSFTVVQASLASQLGSAVLR